MRCCGMEGKGKGKRKGKGKGSGRKQVLKSATGGNNREEAVVVAQTLEGRHVKAKIGNHELQSDGLSM